MSGTGRCFQGSVLCTQFRFSTVSTMNGRHQCHWCHGEFFMNVLCLRFPGVCHRYVACKRQCHHHAEISHDRMEDESGREQTLELHRSSRIVAFWGDSDQYYREISILLHIHWRRNLPVSPDFVCKSHDVQESLPLYAARNTTPGMGYRTEDGTRPHRPPRQQSAARARRTQAPLPSR